MGGVSHERHDAVGIGIFASVRAGRVIRIYALDGGARKTVIAVTCGRVEGNSSEVR